MTTKTTAKKDRAPARFQPSTFLKLVDIYHFIMLKQADGETPSLRDFEKIGVKSSSVALYYLRRMRELNMIQEREQYKARTIRLNAQEEWDERILDFINGKDTR